ncbi:MAG: cysteine desulfurase [Ignavibacteriaceae bacterium]|nr:cysteine desulfurase [Ignavibacteriaceae bacterium]HPO56624.1 cysteine desulfurase [Ignavibacteriaceae bacterium]
MMETTLNIKKIREDFPILQTLVHNKPLVYFDNAATTHKPKAVIDKVAEYYLETNSNIHRGVHLLSQKATSEYEAAREKVLKFINAKKLSEIIFTKGTTDSINLVASSFGRAFIKEGDEILISYMEHHSNIVPWQILCETTGAKLKVIPINDDGELIMEEYEKLLSPRTKLVSIVHISNSLGTINPVKKIAEIAHEKDIPVLIDGAQGIQHSKVDVQDLDCDFYVFSGHKLYGPTGVGVLYGKQRLLEQMPPYQGGGDMISKVTFEKTKYNTLPYKFEAGTPNIVGVIGLGTAIDYMNGLDTENLFNYEHELSEYAHEKFRNSFPGLTIIGNAKEKTGIISFILEGIHPHDIGTILDFEGIAIRTGHHCTQPVMDRFGVPATARLSLGIYNTREEIDYAVNSIKKVYEVFG